jgi:hypothetical protein
LKTHIYTYTDTDSLHIKGEYYEKLNKMGYISDKMGYLDNDIKNDGIIIKEKNLAPKCYFYEYINNKNEIKINENGTMKAKGIPKKCLEYNYYNEYNKNKIICEFSGLRKKHKNLTRQDVENGLNHFSIINNTQTRQFMKNEWSGMNLINNCYYPKGYNKI